MSPLDDARAKRKPGELIWAEQVYAGGARKFHVGTFRHLYDELMALPKDQRVREEVYAQGQPARLFYDMDGEKLTYREAETMLAELLSRTDDVLLEIFDLKTVRRWVFDASTPEKQSRHVHYDAPFATLSDLRAFVNIVLDRCKEKRGPHVCAVDRGKYLKDDSAFGATSNLRLPGCCKLGKSNHLELVPGGEALVFEKCMVTVLPNDDVPLLHMPMEISEPKRMRVDEGESLITQEAYERLMAWVGRRASQKPYVQSRLGNTVRGSAKGIRCMATGRVHKSNKMGFSAYFRGNAVDAWFTCMDDDCKRAAIRCDEDLFPVCFPEKARALMNACYPLAEPAAE